MRIRRNRAEDDTGVDLTPMLDIVFIMLIFFIVTATFLRETGIDVLRPPPNPPSTPQATTASILITLSQSGTVFFADRPIAASAVRSNVERFLAENPDGSVIISSSPKAKTRNLVEVIDQVRQAKGNPVVIEAAE